MKRAYRKALEQIARVEGHSRHSPLWRWMHEHRDALAKSIRPRNTDWAEVCRVVSEAGLLDAHGKALSPVLVRKTWAKVARTMTRPALQVKPAAEPMFTKGRVK